jgi:3-oxoacyl-(acyl-carrier-protein) synthase/pimeloyl-ACP methyl ester carboxylesterase/acyl carrier protein
MRREIKPTDVSRTVRQAISKETKIQVEQLRTDAPFESYGIESVMSVAIVRDLEDSFGDLPKALLFEYQTIAALEEFLVSEYCPGQNEGPVQAKGNASSESIQGAFSDTSISVLTSAQKDTGPAEKTVRTAGPPSSSGLPDSPAVQNSSRPMPDRHSRVSDEIAIIGLSGRFPQAENLEQFWANLCQGRDCITEIPSRLWNWKRYWDPEPGTTGKSYSKWGGFIEDSDCFDPLFFGLSNLAAEGMDPQERLFLEAVHHTLEDAGYTRELLREKRVGVYVSAMWSDYQHYGSADASTDSSFASIANRASYFFDLRGPSIALDTTCAGSLTTLHLACESLRHGETELAIAGGVNVTSHPHKYLVLSRTGFAAKDGRCRSFGAEASGYVPGDGVGAVLLKPLDNAVRDGDRILAVIKSSCINHGGRTSGFTVPSADAQSRLIDAALRKARIDPRTITYVEAHAPGTSLGDPIEIRGLTQAFRKHTDESGFCAIGSVKSNIGHLESAAGLAGIAKVVLQLQHRQLVPSIGAEQINPNVRFEGTPFYLQSSLSEWKPAVLEQNGRRTCHPRRATVSAFGSGGANAYVVLEEYVPPIHPRTPNSEHLIVLSAKAEDRLRAVVENLISYVQKRLSCDDPLAGEHGKEDSWQLRDRISAITGIGKALLDREDHLSDLAPQPQMRDALSETLRTQFGIDCTPQMLESATLAQLEDMVARSPSASTTGASSAYLLEQIAYTLQVGREAMQYRFAALVHSLPELLERFRSYLIGAELPGQTWTGKVTNLAADVIAHPEEKEYVNRLALSRRHDKLARLWCTGATIPWAMMYSDPKPARIALPLYPFARERCWTNTETLPAASVNGPVPAGQARVPGTVQLKPINGPETVDFRGLTFHPTWSPISVSSMVTAGNGATEKRFPRQLIVYPSVLAPLVLVLKKYLPKGETYEIALGRSTEVIERRRWEIDVFDPLAIGACLANIERLDTVYFFGGCHTADWEAATKAAFDKLQSQSVLQLFRLVKALETMKRDEEAVKLKVITGNANLVLPEDQVQPFTAAVTGFARALSREFPWLAAEIIDIGISEKEQYPPITSTNLHAAMQYAVSGNPGDREFAVRKGQMYARQMVPCDLPSISTPVFKENGVYVVIGGAGVVGSRLSRHLAANMPVRCVWIGRRTKDESIARAITDFERCGSRLAYMMADATNEQEMTEAFDTIERQYGAIDGVLHLAMVHEVARIADMNEAQLRRTLAAKVDSTFTLYSVLRHRSIGFVTLFSSAESYVGNIGWSAYAAACSFQDAFSLFWARQVPWPVLAVNWGYWEGMDPDISEMMAAKGVNQLLVKQGAAILETALSSKIPQLIALNVAEHVLERMGIKPFPKMNTIVAEQPVPTQHPMTAAAHSPSQNGGPGSSAPELALHVRNGDIAAQPESLMASNGSQSARESHLPIAAPAAAAAVDMDAVNHGLIGLLSGVLKIDKTRFDVTADLINYGIDSLTVVALHKTLEQRVGTTLPATLFLTYHTIKDVAGHLIEKYPELARKLSGSTATAAADSLRAAAPANASANASAVPAKPLPKGTLLRRLKPFDAAEYLQQYGTLFHEHKLETAASSIGVEALRTPGDDLLHFRATAGKAQGVEILARGTGIPVLLLPAVGLTAPTWIHQLTSPLCETMRLFVSHPPGYGMTDPIADCTTRGIAGVLGDMVDLIVSDRRVHIVASCLGCMAGMYLARFFPEKIASLTLVGAFHDTSDMTVADPAKLTADELSHILISAVDKVKIDFAHAAKCYLPAQPSALSTKEGLLDLLLRSLCANSLIAMRYLNEMLTMSPLEWLPGIEVPTQCIYGSNDKIVSAHHSQTIARAIRGAELIEIEGAGHFPYLTHAAKFNTLVERFIWQNERTGSPESGLRSENGRAPGAVTAQQAI